MGELHLEITIYRVQNDYKIPVTTSPPIVVYREGVRTGRSVRRQIATSTTGST